ncbi:SGNH/GDSL hydrolase family protein [Brevundimonas staleyi]|uniref:SGNH/GDSL hydrolase family protein n=1 Tax=Brevundimonas staleyi TaxID=74326 RepID=A0ABW0FYC5_9CAUL
MLLGVGKVGRVGRVGSPHARPTGGGAWRATKAALAAYLDGNDAETNNPHVLDAMASPPTVATSTSSGLLSGLSVNRRWTVNPETFRLTGGSPTTFASTYLRFNSAQRSVSVQESSIMRVGMICTGSKVGFQLLGDDQPFRFIVDGQYVDKTGTTTATSSGANYLTLDFGSSATRLVEIELQNDQGLHGFWATGLSAAPAFAQRMLVLGDSFTDGTGATHKGDVFAAVAADYLGIGARIASGVGSTGYVNTASGTRYKLVERLPTDLARATTEGAVDAVVIAMGINDLALSASVAAEAAACFDLIRATLPGALVFVTTAWDTAAPSAPSANYLAVSAAIQSALGTRGGFYLLDAEGVEFTKSDATHPDTAGHSTLGEWLNAEIRASIAA